MTAFFKIGFWLYLAKLFFIMMIRTFNIPMKSLPSLMSGNLANFLCVPGHSLMTLFSLSNEPIKLSPNSQRSALVLEHSRFFPLSWLACVIKMNEPTKINFDKFLYVLPSESFISISHVFFTTMWRYYCLNLHVKKLKQGVGKCLT